MRLIILILIMLIATPAWGAQAVLIAEGTHVEGRNNIGDIQSIHDDDTFLKSDGYANNYILQIPGMTVEELRAELEKKRPQKRRNKKGEQEWLDGVVWRKLKNRPEYSFTFKELNTTERTSLESGITSKASKLNIIRNNLEDKIHLDTDNATSIGTIE